MHNPIDDKCFDSIIPIYTSEVKRSVLHMCTFCSHPLLRAMEMKNIEKKSNSLLIDLKFKNVLSMV